LTELDQKDESNLADEKDMILYFVIGGAVLIVIMLAFCMFKIIRFYKNKSKDAVKMLIKESKENPNDHNDNESPLRER